MSETNTNTFRCVYCGRQKPDAERSLEHIWPQGLGGAYAPTFFLTKDVCERCNNNVGLFIDGEYQRNYFMGVESISAALRLIDDTRPVALPLVFFGINPLPPREGEICEHWLGPRGEKIYYLHSQDRDDYRTYAGGDPIKRRRRDPGRVYLSLCRPNMFWIDTVMLSVRGQFPRAELRLLTTTDAPHLLSQTTAESEQSTSDRAYLDQLWREKTSNTRMTLSVFHAQRFQAKIALGFGHALFGHSFAQLPYEGLLRTILWEREPSRCGNLATVETSFFNPPPSDAIFDTLPYPGAFTFLFSGSQNGSFLSMFSPNGRRMDTQIAPAPLLLPSAILQEQRGPFVVLIVPALRVSIGPIPVGHYVMHRVGALLVPELAQLDAKQSTIEELERRLRRFEIGQSGAPPA